MNVRRTGEWDKARRLLAAGPSRLRDASEQLLHQEAQRLRSDIVRGITAQAPGGKDLKPPSPLTLAARRLKRRGGTKALVVRGDLRNGITAIVRGGQAFIGVPRKARDKSGRPLFDVAQVQEFGAGPIVIPITPAMRRYLRALHREAGLNRSRGRSRGGRRGVVVISIPPRPFLRPAFDQFRRDVGKRVLATVGRQLGWRSR